MCHHNASTKCRHTSKAEKGRKNIFDSSVHGVQERTFQGMLAFQQRQASDRCCRIVRALFCFTPSGMLSRMSARPAQLSVYTKSPLLIDG